MATKRNANPTRIGLFVLGAVAVLVAVALLVSRGGLFSARERAVAHFEGSVYGLQEGAPVVFRGVRLGSVVGIGVVYEGTPGRYAIPVELEIESGRITSIGGGNGAVSVAELVRQGLTAQLSTQSLLTGLLYVDLDLRDKAPAATARSDAQGRPEIPTVATTIQELQRQLRQLDIGRLVDDVSAVAASARQLVANPQVLQTLDELARASGELRTLLGRLDRRVEPLAAELQQTLASARQTVEQAGQQAATAADKVGRAADGVGATMARVEALADTASPAMASVQRAADDLARTSAALRAATADDGGLLLQTERAAQDIARASRAVRDLADLLQRQPEALIRGRSEGP